MVLNGNFKSSQRVDCKFFLKVKYVWKGEFFEWRCDSQWYFKNTWMYCMVANVKSRNTRRNKKNWKCKCNVKATILNLYIVWNVANFGKRKCLSGGNLNVKMWLKLNFLYKYKCSLQWWIWKTKTQREVMSLNNENVV